MADFRKVNPDMYLAPQISVADLDAAAALGIKTVICNRPDGEEPGQPPCADLKDKAEGLGMGWFLIPITSGQLSFEAIEETAKTLASAEKPVLAFCRSGTRSSILWGLSQALSGTMTTAEVISGAAVAGYDLSHLTPTLDDLYSRSGTT